MPRKVNGASLMIRSIKALVTKLGGAKKVSKHLGCSEDAIEWWISDSRIPEGWHYRLYFLAKARGLSIDPYKVFGLPKNFGQD